MHLCIYECVLMGYLIPNRQHVRHGFKPRMDHASILGMGKTILFTERERTSSLTKKNRTRTTILSFFAS